MSTPFRSTPFRSAPFQSTEVRGLLEKFAILSWRRIWKYYYVPPTFELYLPDRRKFVDPTAMLPIMAMKYWDREITITFKPPNSDLPELGTLSMDEID